MHPLYGALPVSYVSVRVTRCARVHTGILMSLLGTKPRSTAGLLFPFQCLCGTIFVAQYSMVWDLRVFRAGPPMIFYWFSARSVLVFLCVPFLSFYRLVLWDCKIRTERVQIALSLSLTLSNFLAIITIIKIIIIIMIIKLYYHINK